MLGCQTAKRFSHDERISMNRTQFSRLVAFATLAVLGGCGPFGRKEQPTAVSEDVLLTIDGQPALTVRDFEQYEEQIFQANPQLRSMMAVMPDIEKNLFDALASQELLWADAVRKGVDQSPEFNREVEQNVRMIKRGLAVRNFQKDNTVTISDADIKKYYDDNKETIYQMAPSGIQTTMVVFDKEPEARAFMEKAKGKSDFAKFAQDSKLNARNLGRINDQSSYIDESVKKTVLGTKKFPSTLVMKMDDGKWAVIHVKSKEEAKYYPLDQAREDARTRLYNEKMAKLLTDTLEKLKKEYNAVENTQYFAKKAAERAGNAEKEPMMLPSMAMQAPDAPEVPERQTAQIA